jgi:hypothetical protein
MTALLYEIGHKKFYFKNKKYYAPVVRFRAGDRFLRRSAKTASAAEENARRTMARYLRLLACTPIQESNA